MYFTWITCDPINIKLPFSEKVMIKSCFLSFCDFNERKFSSALYTAAFYYNER